MVFLFAKRDSRKIYTSQKPGTDRYSLQKITSCRNLPFDPAEDMENSLSFKIDNGDQSSSAFNGDRVYERVATNALKQHTI